MGCNQVTLVTSSSAEYFDANCISKQNKTKRARSPQIDQDSVADSAAVRKWLEKSKQMFAAVSLAKISGRSTFPVEKFTSERWIADELSKQRLSRLETVDQIFLTFALLEAGTFPLHDNIGMNDVSKTIWGLGGMSP